MYEVPELADARSIRPGTDDPIYRWSACKRCNGWGWLHRRPFAAFDRDPVQCPVCERAYKENAANSKPANDGAEQHAPG